MINKRKPITDWRIPIARTIPINKPIDPAEADYTICLTRPGGGETLLVGRAELDQYNLDPDGYAAEHFGFATIDEYREWAALDGTPLCSEQTKSGELCRNSISRSQREAADWKALHRTQPCTVHSQMTGVRS
jgi:hypothetical protein